MSYMNTPTLSYTMRMPSDLKRLLDSAAKAGGVSLASLVVEACWKYLDKIPQKETASLTAPSDVPKMNPAMQKFFANIDPSHAAHDPEFDESKIMCRYKEYDGESGETMACGLPEHSQKQKHGNWRRA